MTAKRDKKPRPAAKPTAPTPTRSALRRQRERELRLQTILDAAGTLFAREGYHQTGMERIADEAEVSVGTVYFYFKNKEDLLVKLLDQTGYELRNLLGTAFKNADGTLEGLRRAGKVFFEDFCPNHPENGSRRHNRKPAGPAQGLQGLRSNPRGISGGPGFRL